MSRPFCMLLTHQWNCELQSIICQFPVNANKKTVNLQLKNTVMYKFHFISCCYGQIAWAASLSNKIISQTMKIAWNTSFKWCLNPRFCSMPICEHWGVSGDSLAKQKEFPFADQQHLWFGKLAKMFHFDPYYLKNIMDEVSNYQIMHS